MMRNEEELMMVLKSINDYNEILKKLKREGYDVNGTYEFIGKGLKTIPMTTSDIIELFNLDKGILDRFVKAISNFESTKVGPYITEKYFLLVPDLKEAVMQLNLDNQGSRRCVITFPKEHCFQSIQFLVRDKTIHVVCFMRSCDAIKNLPYDMWLCSFLADMFSYYMEDKAKPYKHHYITMSFGSLHVYKEDLMNVL